MNDLQVVITGKIKKLLWGLDINKELSVSGLSGKKLNQIVIETFDEWIEQNSNRDKIKTEVRKILSGLVGEDDFRAGWKEGEPGKVDGELYIETFDEDEYKGFKNKILVHRGDTKIGWVYKHPDGLTWVFQLIQPVHDLSMNIIVLIRDLLQMPEKTIETIKGKGKQKYFSDMRVEL